jgi:hypothetical protein
MLPTSRTLTRVFPCARSVSVRIFCTKKDILPTESTTTAPTETPTTSLDPQKFYELTPEEQREVLARRYEREIAQIQARRAELDAVSHHTPGFNQLSLGEKLKVEKGLDAPKDVKAYLELLGFDVRRNEIYPVHPQVGPAAKVTPYGRNFFYPYAWGVCLVSQIGYMPDVSVLLAGAVAAGAMRVGATAAVAAHNEIKAGPIYVDEAKFFRIPTENLVLTAAIGTSVATASLALVVNPWYACALVPLNGIVTWYLPQYAPLTAAVVGILGSLTGPYVEFLPWEKILPVQAAVLTGAACSHYVFHMEGQKATVAALGVASLGTAAVLSGMHKMFYPFYAAAGLQIVGTALQNFHVKSEYAGRRNIRSEWYKKVPPGSQQAFFGFMVFLAMIMGRRYSHRQGIILRERATDNLNLDSRELLAPNSQTGMTPALTAQPV